MVSHSAALCSTRSLSQNSSVLPEEEDEKSCSESEVQARASRRKLAVEQQEVCVRAVCVCVCVQYVCVQCVCMSHSSSVFQYGVTPESENLTLSSSGAIDQSSCTGTPLSSTITSPEGTH